MATQWHNLATRASHILNEPSGNITATNVQDALNELDAEKINVGQGGQFLGSASTKAIQYNAQSIAEDITVPSTANAFSCGPITINTGYTVTIETGAVWVVF